MTNEQEQVKSWMAAYGQETPEKPVIPSLEVRKLRAKLILEEALETISALGFSRVPSFGPGGLFEGHVLVEHEEGPNLLEIADGCEDLKVVTEGTLVACGLVVEQEGEKTISQRCDEKGEGVGPEYIHFTGFSDPLFNEVMRSNWTKFWTNQEIAERFKIKVTPELLVACEEGKLFAKRVAIGERDWLVKDKDGKVIKSPSYSHPQLEQFIK